MDQAGITASPQLRIIFLVVAASIAGHGQHVVRARSALFVGGATLFIVVAFLIFQRIANSMGGLGLG
jgi:hypothetical protein